MNKRLVGNEISFWRINSVDNSVYRRFANLPLIIILGYLFFSLFLYEFGPFDWVTYEPFVFWGLNFLYILMLICGWQIGKRVHLSSKIWDYDKDCDEILTFLKYFITINFVFELLTTVRRLQMDSFSVYNLLLNFYEGISNMGAFYHRVLMAAEFGDKASAYGGIYLTIFSVFCCFFSYNVLALGFIFFKKLSFYNKTVLILTYLTIIFQFASTGTNIGIFRLFLMFSILKVINVIRNFSLGSSLKRNRAGKKLICEIIICLIGIFYLFLHIMKSRGGILIWDVSPDYNIGGITINSESLFFQFLPESLHMFLVAISGYLCQGYYGMSLCLRVPWMPCFGIGSSMALTRSLSAVFPLPHLNSYQYRIVDFGWEEGNRWHTMYSWFANDITFLGVIFLMFVIGLLFSVAYRDSIITNNPYAKLLLFYFSLMVIFIPCNNQLFQGYDTMFSFLTALFFWLFSKGRRSLVFTVRKG